MEKAKMKQEMVHLKKKKKKNTIIRYECSDVSDVALHYIQLNRTHFGLFVMQHAVCQCLQVLVISICSEKFIVS